jgi:hypothetical protein
MHDEPIRCIKCMAVKDEEQHGPTPPQPSEPEPASPLPWERAGECIIDADGQPVLRSLDPLRWRDLDAAAHACNAHPGLVAERDGLRYEMGNAHRAQLEQGQRIKDLVAERDRLTERVGELEGIRETLHAACRDYESRSSRRTTERDRAREQRDEARAELARLNDAIEDGYVATPTPEPAAAPETCEMCEHRQVDECAHPDMISEYKIPQRLHVPLLDGWCPLTTPTPAIIAARGSEDARVLRPDVYEKMADDETHLFWEALERSTTLDRGEVVELVRAICPWVELGPFASNSDRERAIEALRPLRHLVEGEEGGGDAIL